MVRPDSRNTRSRRQEKSVCHLRIASQDGNLDTQDTVMKVKEEKKKKKKLTLFCADFQNEAKDKCNPLVRYPEIHLSQMCCLEEVTCVQLVIFFKEQMSIIQTKKSTETSLFDFIMLRMSYSNAVLLSPLRTANANCAWHDLFHVFIKSHALSQKLFLKQIRGAVFRYEAVTDLRALLRSIALLVSDGLIEVSAGISPLNRLLKTRCPPDTA